MKDPFYIALVSGLVGGLVGGILGIVGILISLRGQLSFLSLQLGATELSSIDNIFIDQSNAKLCKYFFDGDMCIDEDKDRAKPIARRMLNHFSFLINCQKKYPQTYDIWVDELVKKRFSTSPILCETLLEDFGEFTSSGQKQLEFMIKGLYRSNEREEQDSWEYRIIEETDSFLQKKKYLTIKDDRDTDVTAKNEGKIHIAKFLENQPKEF